MHAKHPGTQQFSNNFMQSNDDEGSLSGILQNRKTRNKSSSKVSYLTDQNTPVNKFLAQSRMFNKSNYSQS